MSEGPAERQDAETGDVNEVRLRGRLADVPVHREMPSGDVLTTFRLTVTRPPGERGKVDSIECVTARPKLRRKLERATPGDAVTLTGALRRRFWRSPGGPTSRYSVDATELTILRAGRRAGGSAARKPASA